MPFKCLFSAVLCLLFAAPACFAETIYLKDGSAVQGEIVEENSYSVIIRTDNRLKKYFLAEIDRIENDSSGGEEKAVNLSNVNLRQYDRISETKSKLILNYIESSGVREAMEKNVQAAIDRAPADQKETYEDLFNLEEIIELLIPIYDKYYSEQELVAIIQFYDSPAGRKFLESTPEIMKETLDVTIEYINKKMQRYSQPHSVAE